MPAYGSSKDPSRTRLACVDERVQVFLDAIPDGILVVDAQGRVAWANAQVERLFGYTRRELLGQPVELLLPERFREIHRKHRKAYWSQPQTRPMGVSLSVWGKHKDGTEFPAKVSLALLETEADRCVIVTIRDVSAQQEAERRLVTYLEEAHDLIFTLDKEGRLTYANRAVCDLFGYTMGELLGKRPLEFVAPAQREEVARALAQLLRGESIESFRVRAVTKEGREVVLEVRGRILRQGGKVIGTFHIARDVTAQLEAEETLRKLSNVVEQTSDAVFIADRDGVIQYVNPAFERMSGYAREEILGQTPRLFKSGRHEPTFYRRLWETILRGETFRATLINRKKSGELFYVDEVITPLKDDRGRVTHFVTTWRDVTERVKAEEELRAEAHFRERLLHAAEHLSALLEEGKILRVLVGEVQQLFAVDFVHLWLLDEQRQALTLRCREEAEPSGLSIGEERPLSEPGTAIARVARRGEGEVLQHLPELPSERVNLQLVRTSKLQSALLVPLRAEGQVLGVLVLGDQRDPERFSPRDLEKARLFADQAAAALRRARLFADAERRLRRLRALFEIDAAILGSTDLRVSLGMILTRIRAELKADAADVFLWDPLSQTLSYIAGQGFRTDPQALEARTRLRLGKGLVGRVALESRTLCVPDLQDEANLREFTLTPAIQEFLASEGFRAYVGVPLVVRGELQGVLGIFHRQPLTPAPEPEWLEFAEMLARQVAIALDNARLFEDLNQKNLELQRAYDATLEGWVRALDLRDQETEGHTQRVTELTVQLARELGIPEEELIHVRRGALLHDIGKMAIPDSILLKPGRLTKEEWGLIKQHPVHAYEWLREIEYLRPALEIPYCHHERWDGQGYPRGLHGEEIPLSARIFAVVDAWDAMTSDRPYRKALSREEAIEELKRNAGKQFDPKVVEAFLKLLEHEGINVR